MKNPHPRLKLTSLLATACLVFAPAVLAVDPPPGGGYPIQNTALGDDALFSQDVSSTGRNTAIGFQALYGNTTGYDNTALGNVALSSNTTGFGNTAIGSFTLKSNTTGRDNTANGIYALQGNITGSENIAIGEGSLASNNTGYGNTATGFLALQANGTGNYNTASGHYAMFLSSGGSYNTAFGTQALYYGGVTENTATGFNALFYNFGSYNTADGSTALYSNQLGNSNTAVGHLALADDYSGSNNIALGASAGVLITGSNNIDIGNQGLASESGVIRLGTAGTQSAIYVAGILNSPLASALAIGISPTGQLGVRGSSARFKEAIKPMDKASEAILSLQPVSFRYKKEFDPTATPQFGLVAEEVEKVDPDLVARDAAGKAFTVRYEEVNAMLLNEFLKEHRKVADQGDQITELKTTVAGLKSALKAQAAQIQKVSDQLNTPSAGPRVVAKR